MMRHTLLAIGSLGLVVAACRDTSEPTSQSIPPSAARAEIGEHQRSEKDPAWWNKYQFLLRYGPNKGAEPTLSALVGDNVDVSNECAPQSETFIALNPGRPDQLTAGSNEIFRLPQRAFFSSDDGGSWGGVDVP